MAFHFQYRPVLVEVADRYGALPADPSAKRSLASRMPQLDGLRGIAALGVVATHTWFPLGLLGQWRVKLFFVLSGYLICRILLHGRTLRQSGEVTTGHFLKTFYARRALRLLPPLVLTILVSRIVNFPMGESIWWHLGQATNIFVATTSSWGAGSLNHLWSLNIEEQFCLVFPIVLLMAPDGYVVPLLVSMVAVEPLYELAGSVLGWNSVTVSVLAPAFLGSFCIGGFLAAMRWRRIDVPFLAPAALLSLALVLTLSWLAGTGHGTSERTTVLGEFAMNILLGAVVALAARSMAGWPWRLLESGPLVSLGRISYGLFLYHLPVMGVVLRLRLHFHADPLPYGPQQFALVLALSLVLAVLSYRFLEAPLELRKQTLRYASSDAR